MPRYSEVEFAQIDEKQRIQRCVRQAALATLILQEVAAILSNPATALDTVVDTWPNASTNCIKSLISPPQPAPAPPTGAPAAADLFLLQSIRPHNQLLKVLKSNPLLTKLGIAKWFVNDSIFHL